MLRIRSHSTCTILMTPLLVASVLLLPIAVHAQSFPVMPLTIGVHLIRAEVATTDAERARGLMFRDKLGENEGMVFRFPSSGQACMWMKNTLLPLSVAFIGDDGRIINIEDMQPKMLNSHCAKRPARYALEMNKGWFRKRNIKPGTAVDGLPK